MMKSKAIYSDWKNYLKTMKAKVLSRKNGVWMETDRKSIYLWWSQPGNVVLLCPYAQDFWVAQCIGSPAQYAVNAGKQCKIFVKFRSEKLILTNGCKFAIGRAHL